MCGAWLRSGAIGPRCKHRRVLVVETNSSNWSVCSPRLRSKTFVAGFLDGCIAAAAGHHPCRPLALCETCGSRTMRASLCLLLLVAAAAENRLQKLFRMRKQPPDGPKGTDCAPALQAIQGQLDEAQAGLQAALGDRDSAAARILALEGELVRSQTKVAQEEAEMQQDAEDIQACREAVEQDQTTIQELEKVVVDLSKGRSLAEAEKQSLLDRQAVLEQTIVDLTKEQETVVLEVKALEATKKTMTAELKELTEVVASKTLDLEGAHEAQESMLTHQKELEAIIADLTKAQDQAKVETDEESELYEDNRVLLERLQAASNDKVVLLERQKTLERELATSQRAQEDASRKFEARVADMEAAEERLVQLGAAADKLSKRNEELLDDNQALTRRLEELEAQTKAALAEIESRELPNEDEWRSALEAKDSQLSELQELIERSEKLAEEVMQRKLEEQREEMEAAKNEVHSRALDLEASLETTKAKADELEGKYERARSQGSDLKDKFGKLQKQSRRHKEDAEFWRTQFEERPLVNFTHVALEAQNKWDETRAFAIESFEYVADSVVKGISTTGVVLSELYASRGDLYKRASDQVDASRAEFNRMYKTNVKPHVTKAVETVTPYYEQAKSHVVPVYEDAKARALPIYEDAKARAQPIYKQHVDPLVQQVKPIVADAATKVTTELVKLRDSGSAAIEKGYVNLVDQYRQTCPVAAKSLKDLEKSLSMELPTALHKSLRQSCRKPDETVSTFLKVFGILTLIVFHGLVIRLVKSVVLFIVRVAWFLFPPRWIFAFLFGAKKTTKTVEENGIHNGNGNAYIEVGAQ